MSDAGISHQQERNTKMDGVISFAANGTDWAAAEGRRVAATVALHRYVPHVVAWRCLGAGRPISLMLPESLSAAEVLRRAERERVQLVAADDPEAPDRTLEIHYSHLREPEIEEGIRRLGFCLARYSQLAVRYTPGHPSTSVGA
jgi:hypothetical protein